MAVPQLRPLSPGEILDGAFTLYRRNFVPFAVTAFIPTAVVLAAFLGMAATLFSSMPGARTMNQVLDALLRGMMMVSTVAIFTSLVIWAALTREAVNVCTGQPASVGAGLRTGLRVLPRALGAALITLLGAMVAGLGMGMILFIVVFALSGLRGMLGEAATEALVRVLTAAATLAFIVGVITLMFAVMAALVAENAGPLEAVERSFTLVRGAPRQVAGVMVVALLITLLPGLAVTAVTGGFAQMFDPTAIPTPRRFVVQQVLSILLNILTAPFLVSVTVLLYFDRRVRTEALDVQMMADRLAVAAD